MMQALQSIKANIEIAIPDNFELVQRDEIESLRGQALTGRTWTMQDLREWVGKKSTTWIKASILENPRYSREIQQMVDHHEIKEAAGPGTRWLFKAGPMAEFLDRHWEELPW